MALVRYPNSSRSYSEAHLPGVVSHLPGARVVLTTCVVLLALYLAVLHPWLMSWGATAEEQRMELPGDGTPPEQHFTRAITINAPASEVWAWVVQIGQDRAGFYSNTWLENLTGADIHNSDRIRPEWQQRELGDAVRMAPREIAGGVLGDATATRIRVLEPGRAIGDNPGRFVLLPVDEGTTRLLLREPIAPPSGNPATDLLATAFTRVVWDPMHFVMEQRMLRGIKERAEGMPLVAPGTAAVAQLGWIVAGLATLGLYLSRREWQPWVMVPVIAVIPALDLAGDFQAALVGFLAVGITLLGALAFGRRWWPTYALISAGVLLILLLAPDPYSVFGGLFLSLILATGGGYLHSRPSRVAVRRVRAHPGRVG
jgi:hypothetical protein